MDESCELCGRDGRKFMREVDGVRVDDGISGVNIGVCDVGCAERKDCGVEGGVVFVVGGGDGFGGDVCTLSQKLDIRSCLVPFAVVMAVD